MSSLCREIIYPASESVFRDYDTYVDKVVLKSIHQLRYASEQEN